MRNWDKRCREIAYLLNPAFCAGIIFETITSYYNEKKQQFPFPLVYLVLPIVLHKKTRESINSRTHMKVFLQRNPECLVGFAERAKDLVVITNESLEFLLKCNIIRFKNGTLEVQGLLKKKLQNTMDDEIVDCYKKANSIGKWFARNGMVENIYQCWGVRP